MRQFAPLLAAAAAVPSFGDTVPWTLDQSQIMHADVPQWDWTTGSIPFIGTFDSGAPLTIDFEFQSDTALKIRDIAGSGGEGFTSEAFILGFNFAQVLQHDSRINVTFALLNNGGAVATETFDLIQVFPFDVTGWGIIGAYGGGVHVPPDGSLRFDTIRVHFNGATDPDGNPITLDMDQVQVGFRADRIRIVPAPGGAAVLTLVACTAARRRRD